MALRYVLDEHLRGRPYLAILRHNARGGPLIDVVQVGDPVDLPRGTQDPDLIRWAAKENRIIVARDKATLPRHLQTFVAGGGSSPEIFMVRGVAWNLVVEFLICASHASEPAQWVNCVTYIP